MKDKLYPEDLLAQWRIYNECADEYYNLPDHTNRDATIADILRGKYFEAEKKYFAMLVKYCTENELEDEC